MTRIISPLKTTYRRNFWIGQTVSVFLASVLLFLVLMDREETVVIPMYDSPAAKAGSIMPKVIHPPFSQNRIRHLAAFSEISSGWIIVPDQETSPEGMIHHVTHKPFPIIFDTPLLFESDILGGEWGDYYGNFINWPGPDGNDGWPCDDTAKSFPFSFDYYQRDLSFLAGNRPAVIDLKKPLYPHNRNYNGDALVTLRFAIDSHGNIIEIETIREEPEGYGFALALREALRDSWISPAKKNGKKLGGAFLLTYEFCWDCPAKPAVIKSPDDVIVTTSLK